MAGATPFETLLDALVMREASYDTTRLEKICSALIAHAPAHPTASAAATMQAALRSPDYRKTAVCCRLWGHTHMPPAAWSAVWPLLRHPEPLVRHAALYAARHAALVPPPPHCSWMERLLDESLWVQQEAHRLFATALGAGAVPDAHATLAALYGNVSAHAERPLLRLSRVLADTAVTRAAAEAHGVPRVLLERHVVEHPLSWEAMATLDVLSHWGSWMAEQLPLLRHWVQSGARTPRTLASAVALLAVCPPPLQAQLVPTLADLHGPAAVLPALRPLGAAWASVAAAVLAEPRTVVKAQCAAAALLSEWRTPVATDVVRRMLHSNDRRVIRAALQLPCDEWNALHDALAALQERRDVDPLLCPLVWGAIATYDVHDALNGAVAVYLDASSLPADVRAQAWERLFPWMGPHHAHAPAVVEAGLCLRHVPPHCLARTLDVVRLAPWTELHRPAQCAAVAHCLRRCDDDSAPAMAALRWMDAHPTAHPETPTLVAQCGVRHSARCVRAAAWSLLHEHASVLCGKWPELRAVCAGAEERAAHESVEEVYGSSMEQLLLLLDDAMIDTGEPDCC